VAQNKLGRGDAGSVRGLTKKNNKKVGSDQAISEPVDTRCLKGALRSNLKEQDASSRENWE